MLAWGPQWPEAGLPGESQTAQRAQKRRQALQVHHRRGEVRTDNSDNNVIEAYATDGLEDVIVRRGCPP
ncbi:MAG TPA: hypothetical protein VM487_01695 [Phycisphaerae bacterium]|nr:hypothetical protein [Phycisphaerae bacterium]